MYGRQVIAAAIVIVLVTVLTIIASSHKAMAYLILAEGGMTEAKVENTTTTTEAGINQPKTEFLGIQSAQSGSISQINATTFTLELSNVSDNTILFSDRPDRLVTPVSTTDFIGNWTEGADSFAADPPNAVLILDDKERQQIAIIELFNPAYDSKANVLKYDISPVNATSINLPKELGQSTVLIDRVRHPTQY